MIYQKANVVISVRKRSLFWNVSKTFIFLSDFVYTFYNLSIVEQASL